MDTMKAEKIGTVEAQKVYDLLCSLTKMIKDITEDKESTPMSTGYKLGMLHEVIYNWMNHNLYPVMLGKKNEESKEE